MIPLSSRVAELLDRHPGAALSRDELLEHLAMESPHPVSDPVDALRGRASGVRVLEAPRRRWSSGLSSITWIVGSTSRRVGDLPRRSLPGRLRRSLRSLSGAVDPGSAVAWARLSRLLAEEPELRAALAREQNGGKPPTTTRPPHPPHRR